MAKRRSAHRGGRSARSVPAFAEEEDPDEEEDSERTYGSESAPSDGGGVIDEIMSTVHPFEAAGLCGPKGLSPVQKAITYVMQHRGGYASDDEILVFLRKHWSQIMQKSDRQSRQPPDKRILHINYSIQKEQRFLFVRSPTDPDMFGINTPEAPIETSRRINEQAVPFPERVIDLLRSYGDGLTLDEVVQYTQSYADADGMHQGQPLRERALKVLKVKEALQELEFDAGANKWRIRVESKRGKSRGAKGAEGPAPGAGGTKITEMTVNELWYMLKEKGVY